MVLIRTFENQLLELFQAGELMGTTHTCLGQEANAVGVCLALRKSDMVISSHRGHGHFIAHVGDVDGLMAEVMGKSTGVCGGWGGSQHLCVPNSFYANGIQGGTVPLATGLAMGEQLQEHEGVACVFVGDGTFGQGTLYESLNLAAKRNAPLVMVVENNDIAQSTPRESVMAGSFSGRAKAFDIPYQEIEYPSVEEVFIAAETAISAARSGDGPQLLVIHSTRLGPHSKGDDTRSNELVEQLHKLDPLKRSEDKIEHAQKAWTEAKKTVADAVAKAKLADFAQIAKPDLDNSKICESSLDKVSGKTFLQNINEGLDLLLGSNSKVVLYGEDVLDPYGGAFKATKGLSTAYPDLVFNTPISEAAMIGIAGGMAMRGIVPVVEIMFGDFLTLGFDQLVNHLAKYRSMFNNQVRVPAIIRTPMGGRRGYGPTHSQTLDKHFSGITGLQVFAPSPFHDVGSLFLRAAETDTPTLIIENKAAYSYRVPKGQTGMSGDFFVEYKGKADAPWVSLSLTNFEDEEATIICYGGMVSVAMEATLNLLMQDEISVRILAPSRLHPLEGQELISLLAPEGPVLVAEEGGIHFGFGSEISALLAEKGILKTRDFARLGAKELAIACAQPLENQVLPQCDDIYNAVLELI